MQITWYGHSAFRLDFKGQALLIDPFFTGNPAFASDKAAAMKGVSHILLTHGHSDHIGDTLDIAKSTGATVTANFEICMWLAGKGLEKYNPMNTGGTTSLGDFSVTLVRACIHETVSDGLPGRASTTKGRSDHCGCRSTMPARCARLADSTTSSVSKTAATPRGTSAHSSSMFAQRRGLRPDCDSACCASSPSRRVGATIRTR